MRIKITGYINTEDLEPHQIDSGDPTGLSEVGYLELVAGENGQPLTLQDLEDCDVEAQR